MNKDSYAEQIVKRKSSAISLVLKALSIVLTALSLLTVVYWFGMFIVLICVGITYLAFRNGSVEYEYTYINGELTIDKIFSKSKRKRAKSIDMEKVLIVANYESHHLDHYKNDRQFKTEDFSSGIADANRYMIVTEEGGIRKGLIFEPDERVLHAMKMSAPSKVNI